MNQYPLNQLLSVPNQRTMPSIGQFQELWNTPTPRYVRNRMYALIFDSINAIAVKHDAAARFVASTDLEDLGIVVRVGIERGNEVFELDFGRIVGMLEKQRTLDLDWSEVEQYIAVTCAMLPSRKRPAEEEQQADLQQQMAQFQKMMALSRLMGQAQQPQQVGGVAPLSPNPIHNFWGGNFGGLFK